MLKRSDDSIAEQVLQTVHHHFIVYSCLHCRLLQTTFKSCYVCNVRACHKSQPLPVAATCAQLLVVIYKFWQQELPFWASQFRCYCPQTLEVFTTPIPRLDTDTHLHNSAAG